MYLQGNLQNVFDALYKMGIIGPTIDSDWSKEMECFDFYYNDYLELLKVVNGFQGNVGQLVACLERFDEKILTYLAMEVAREFTNFHSKRAVH